MYTPSSNIRLPILFTYIWNKEQIRPYSGPQKNYHSKK